MINEIDKTPINKLIDWVYKNRHRLGGSCKAKLLIILESK